MFRRSMSAVVVMVGVGGASWLAAETPQAPRSAPWHFLVAGDARNCGDVVMPAIAQTAIKNQAAFYLHLGDLRATYTFDEDIEHQPAHIARPLTISDYLTTEWTDFIDSQIAPFGSIPFILGIGNHETIAPKTRQDFLLQFADWLDTPMLKAQRLKDDPHDYRMKTYFHWIDRGVSFFHLDNATDEQFDTAQVRWFERVLAKDSADASVTSIVVGMHEALPESFGIGHSMNQSVVGTESGRRVYADLLQAQNVARKHVYVIASHSHFYMEDIYDTEYWQQHGGVLPGWIVGTSGAVRYALPDVLPPAPAVSRTNVYGSLLGTVQASGEIRFAFQGLAETDIPAKVVQSYGQDFVHWCFANNSQVK